MVTGRRTAHIPNDVRECNGYVIFRTRYGSLNNCLKPQKRLAAAAEHVIILPGWLSGPGVNAPYNAFVISLSFLRRGEHAATIPADARLVALTISVSPLTIIVANSLLHRVPLIIQAVPVLKPVLTALKDSFFTSLAECGGVRHGASLFI